MPPLCPDRQKALQVDDEASQAVAGPLHGQADGQGPACTRLERLHTVHHELLPSLTSRKAHIAILLVNVAELEPDIPRCQRSRRIVEDVSEALRDVSAPQHRNHE